MHVTQRIRRNGQNPDPPLQEFVGGPLDGRYKKEVVQGPVAYGWWTVRLEPICDAFQGKLTGGAQKQAGDALARVRFGGDAEVPPLICTWPVNRVVQFSVWGTTVAVEALPMTSTVEASSGNPGPDFCASVIAGRIERPALPQYAQETEQVDADNAQRIPIPPYARRVQVNVENGTTVEATWTGPLDGGYPLVRELFFGPDNNPATRFNGNQMADVPPNAAWLDLQYSPAGTLVWLVWEMEP